MTTRPAESGPSPANTTSVLSAKDWDGTVVYGRVIGTDGKAAPGVPVAATLVSDYSSGLVANNAANLVASSPYRVQAVNQETVSTDGSGNFQLKLPNGAVNLEAVQSPAVKAIDLGVSSAATTSLGDPILLQLAPTGNISGKVAASNAAVTDLHGIEVYIPGTSYVAVTDQAGNYTLSNLPIGAFTVIGSSTNLGEGTIGAVPVSSSQTTNAPAITLSVTPPVLSSISPYAAAPGSTVTLTGSDFGVSAGKHIMVVFGGAIGENVRGVDDQTIKVDVPASARSGDVIVTVGDASSQAIWFTVIPATGASPEPTPSGCELVPYPDLKMGTPIAYHGFVRQCLPVVISTPDPTLILDSTPDPALVSGGVPMAQDTGI